MQYGSNTHRKAPPAGIHNHTNSPFPGTWTKPPAPGVQIPSYPDLANLGTRASADLRIAIARCR